MAERDSKLPEFKKPPVVEVAISVQFEELQVHGAHLGLLWSEYRDSYPLAEQHLPIQTKVEQFEPPKASKPTIEFTPSIPTARYWFLNKQGTRLIQVQPNRFILNWRKLDTEEQYPRYRQIRENFLQELTRFREFIEREGLGEIIPDQSELTYVNHIRMDDVWERHGQVDRVVKLWSSESLVDDYLPEPEEVRLRVTYLIPDDDEPNGRLHVTLDPEHFKADESPLFNLKLIARGAPEGDGIEGALRFLDRGHEWIVQGFTSITSATMHAKWERLQ